MAKQRVMVYVMHEHETAAAQAAVADAYVTEGYVCGEADDAAIDQMRQQGMTVNVMPSAPAAMPPGLDSFGPEDVPVPGYYLIWLQPPVPAHARTAIEATGVRFVERRDDWYCVFVADDAQLGALQGLEWVKAIKPYDADETLRMLAIRPVLTGTWDLLLHAAADQAALETWLADEKIEVLQSGPRKLRIVAGEEQLGGLARRHEIAEIAPWRPPQLRLERSRALVGVDPVPQIQNAGALTGAGVVVGVCDTGLDDQHAAFAGTTRQVIARGRPGDGSDPHGHGTHVTGTIVGRAGGAGAQYTGIAPDAQVVVQSVLDAGGGLGGLPFDLNDLLDEAYQKEVRIHNDSWGSDTRGAYTMSSREIDEFVWKHPDMLVVIAAGNDGSCLPPRFGQRKSKAGFVDWKSVGAPGTSKNALVVGACRSDRTQGGFSTLKHRDVWPATFPDDPIGDATVSGDAEQIAGFSSRGPCDGHRVKPDVVAPGTDIAAPRASTAPAHHFSGVVPGTGRTYGYMCGTSMATPIVAGTAALVRQYLVQQRSHQPSAALLKALLINGARPLTGDTAVADSEGVPNYHQGFGCISLLRSIPVGGDFVLAFRDDWQDPARAFRTQGTTRRRFKVTTTKQAPLRITLAYTDYFANGVQNNLNLLLDIGGKQRTGNEALAAISTLPDAENNVEVIRVDDAPAATYFVSVVVSSLLEEGQHFALVVSGALDSDTLKDG